MPEAPRDGVSAPVAAIDLESPQMAMTEIVLAGGERLRIDGDAKVIESEIVSAARGSIMELAWLIDAQTGDRVGINPDQVLMLRELGGDATPT
jgi:hypothetical protein